MPARARLRTASAARPTEAALSAGGADVWDSGRVESDRCWLVPYTGPLLRSRQRVFWSVTVWDDEGTPSADEPTGAFELGLLGATDWQADWIAPAERGAPCSVSYLQGQFMLDGPGTASVCLCHRTRPLRVAPQRRARRC